MSDSMKISFLAAADLSAAQYHIMRIANGVDRVNIASEDVHNSMIGVLQNKPAAAGRGAAIGHSGEGKVVAGAAISSAGIFFTTNGSGRAIAATSGDMIAGRVLETATADGDVIRALYMTPFRLGPV